MSRLLTVLAALSLILTAACTTQPHAGEGSAAGTAWSIKADYTDACSCAPSCPCLFGSGPTLGHCEGITLVEIESGHYGDVGLDGIKVLPGSHESVARPRRNSPPTVLDGGTPNPSRRWRPA